MKRIYLYIIGVSLGLLLLFSHGKHSQQSQTIDYSLEGKTLKLLVADTEKEREIGLMNRRKLDGADGMIFIFEDKSYRTFWNKNTLADLDIVWLDGSKVVGKDFLPSIEKTKQVFSLQSPAKVNKVIELIRKQ